MYFDCVNDILLLCKSVYSSYGKHIPLYDKNLLLIIYVNNVSVKCERQHLFIKNPVWIKSV